jgi:glycerophosphoryl diester phosphodiesterase
MPGVPLLLGHRGSRDSRSIRENTFAAFDRAIEQGCDGFEFDVRLAKDGAAVICHNAKFKRLTISRTTVAQLPGLCLLREVLDRYSRRTFLDIELKVPSLTSQLLSALHEHPPQRGYVVSSFLPEVLTELSSRGNSIPLGFICDRRKHLRFWTDLPVQYVIPHYLLLTRKLIREVHSSGKKLLTWTVNGKATMLRLAEWEVDGIISDKTAQLVKTLRPGASSRELMPI